MSLKPNATCRSDGRRLHTAVTKIVLNSEWVHSLTKTKRVSNVHLILGESACFDLPLFIFDYYTMQKPYSILKKRKRSSKFVRIWSPGWMIGQDLDRKIRSATLPSAATARMCPPPKRDGKCDVFCPLLHLSASQCSLYFFIKPRAKDEQGDRFRLRS